MSIAALTSQINSLARVQQLYEQAARMARVGGWECDLETEKLTWTPGVYDLFELRQGPAPRRSMIVDLYHEDSRWQMEQLRAEAIRTGRGFTLDAQIRTRLGANRWMRLTAEVVRENGKSIRIQGAKQDITHEKLLWERLRQRAERDPLTGLANRSVFETRYGALTSGKEHAVSALVLIDLDRFKEINDHFGHEAGDECLRQVATRLTRAFGCAALVSRIGGDEFAVLLAAPMLRVEITQALHAALSALCLPVLWKGQRIEAGVSIGATILRASHRRDPSRIFAEADAALYAAKAAGRGVIRIHGDEVEEGRDIDLPRAPYRITRATNS